MWQGYPFYKPVQFTPREIIGFLALVKQDAYWHLRGSRVYEDIYLPGNPAQETTLYEAIRTLTQLVNNRPPEPPRAAQLRLLEVYAEAIFHRHKQLLNGKVDANNSDCHLTYGELRRRNGQEHREDPKWESEFLDKTIRFVLTDPQKHHVLASESAFAQYVSESQAGVLRAPITSFATPRSPTTGELNQAIKLLGQLYNWGRDKDTNYPEETYLPRLSHLYVESNPKGSALMPTKALTAAQTAVDRAAGCSKDYQRDMTLAEIIEDLYDLRDIETNLKLAPHATTTMALWEFYRTLAKLPPQAVCEAIPYRALKRFLDATLDTGMSHMSPRERKDTMHALKTVTQTHIGNKIQDSKVKFNRTKKG